MFRLGEKVGRVVRRPYIDMLQGRNARTGFFERKEDLRLHAPAGDIRDLEHGREVIGKVGEHGVKFSPALVPRRLPQWLASSRARRYAIVDKAMLKSSLWPAPRLDRRTIRGRLVKLVSPG